MNDLQVSVLLPSFNCENTIVRAVNSALHGTLTPHEILIFDDHSTDNTKKVIEENFGNNKIIKLYEGTENKGAGHARSELLKHASGSIIAFLDADDWWYENKLQRQVDIMMAGNFDVVTSGYDIYDEFGSKLGVRRPIKKINTFTMHFANWLPTSMTIFRKNLKGADEMPKIRKRQDYAFWLKIMKQNPSLKCYAFHDSLGGYLRRSDSLSSNKWNNIIYNIKMFRSVMQYNLVSAITLTFINSAVRIFRK